MPGGIIVKLDFINFNMERTDSHIPGGKLGDLMKEEIPGSWCGTIQFTAQTSWFDINKEDFKL